jgi:hypothetical protein
VSRTIWKYPVAMLDRFSLDIPKDHMFLDVQVQRGAPALWALVDADAPKMRVDFALVGTGNPFPDPDEGEFWHIGTFQLAGGDLVFHLFYRNVWAD